MRRSSAAAAFLLATGLTVGARAEAPSEPARPATIAHEILELESAAADVTPEMYALLDGLLDEAKALGLPPKAASPAQARDALTRIDQLLTRHGFAAPSWGQVETLRDALNPTQIDKSKAGALARYHNDRRAAYIKDHPSAAFHFFDSDSGSFLYMAIGEVTGLPISIMERPGAGAFQGNHHFIRYRLENGAPFYWDVVAGDEQRGVDAAIALDRNMTLGYARWTRANAWLRVASYRRATADFEAAVKLAPANAGVFNGFAWMLATCPDPLYRNGDYAVSYARIATQLAPANPAYEDTLAAALAATGQFAAARAAEQSAIKERGVTGDGADEYHHRAKLYGDGEPYLAARREEQIARDYCEQFSESPRATLQCPAP